MLSIACGALQQQQEDITSWVRFFNRDLYGNPDDATRDTMDPSVVLLG